jgi:diadenosine tetraphosphate (Ap4A) HIT family hydrolase
MGPIKFIHIYRIKGIKGIKGIDMHNLDKILDEGEIKNLRYVIPDMVAPAYWKQCIDRARPTIEQIGWDDVNDCMMREEVPNPDYKRPEGLLRQAIRNASNCMECATSLRVEEQWNRNLKTFGITEQDVLDYLDIVPFTPWVMLNVSPNWKGSYHVIPDDIDPAEREWMELENAVLRDHLTYVIEAYLKESNRFDKYSYVLECGSNGDHLHAHIVAHINPELHKSVETHLNKGNHVQQMKKYSKGLKGIEGCINGKGIQKSILRHQYLVDDKLKYLIEEEKPDGHKNAYVVADVIHKVLFTVK